MDISSLPFNAHIGIQPCREPTQGIFEIADDPKFLNHIESVHASAIFALAEASSGKYLLQQTKSIEQDKYVPTLRRTEMKYRSQGTGRLYSIGKKTEVDWDKFTAVLLKTGRALISFEINIMNEMGKCIATGKFEWFVFKKPQSIIS